jgi:hypothetical protein
MPWRPDPRINKVNLPVNKKGRDVTRLHVWLFCLAKNKIPACFIMPGAAVVTTSWVCAFSVKEIGDGPLHKTPRHHSS